MKPRSHLSQWLGAWLIRTVVHAICATCRLEVVGGANPADDLRRSGEPVVLSFWHNRALFCAYYLYRSLLRRGFPITILVSQSRDGEIGAKLARLWKAGVVRGSASKGGTTGLRRLYRVITKDRQSAITIPDGPRGPKYVAKPGAVVLAQMCGVPIQPMAFAADRCWTIRSWDQLIIPKPFSRIRILFGEPIQVPRQLSSEELEHERLRLETTLNELVRRVENPEP